MNAHAGNARPECIPFVPRGTKFLLDVGCSDGLFAELIQRERPGLVVDGIEPDEVTASHAVGRVRNIYRGLFPDALPADARYDCISFLDCLEHMVDPWGALAGAAPHLNPGGTVVASLPNIRHAVALETLLRRKDWPWEEQGTFDKTHLRFFTERSMRHLFEQCGYRVDVSMPINELTSVRARALARFLGADIKALQFVLVASPLSPDPPMIGGRSAG